ncbi:hypothetical protein ACHAWF_013571 [Thalassiosira exigua]
MRKLYRTWFRSRAFRGDGKSERGGESSAGGHTAGDASSNFEYSSQSSREGASQYTAPTSSLEGGDISFASSASRSAAGGRRPAAGPPIVRPRAPSPRPRGGSGPNATTTTPTPRGEAKRIRTGRRIERGEDGGDVMTPPREEGRRRRTAAAPEPRRKERRRGRRRAAPEADAVADGPPPGDDGDLGAEATTAGSAAEAGAGPLAEGSPPTAAADSALGDAAAGLLYASASDDAEDDDDDDEEEEEEEEIDDEGFPTPASKPPPRAEPKQASPQSVADPAAMTSFPQYGSAATAGGGSSDSDRRPSAARLARPGRRRRRPRRHRRVPSYDDSTTLADDEGTAGPSTVADLDEEEEDDDEDYDGAFGTLRRALFRNRTLDRVHDFLVGGRACGLGGSVGAIRAGCAEGCADDADLVADLGDEFGRRSVEEDSLNGIEDEEEEHTIGTAGDECSVEVSLNRPREEPKGTKKKPSRGRARRQRRRGRSPTAKHGYNSDGGESLRNSSRSRSRTGESLSLADCAEGYDDEDVDEGGEAIVGAAVAYVRAEEPDEDLDEEPGEEPVEELADATAGEGDHPPPPSPGDAGVGRADVAAPTDVVSEGVLSRDRAEWMAMTWGRGGDDARPTERGESSGELALGENAVEGYFKKLVSIGIQLALNEPLGAEEDDGGRDLRRSGKMFLEFGTRNPVDRNFDHPRLTWTSDDDDDGRRTSRCIELLDIRSIREPTPAQAERRPSAAPSRSFVLSTNGGEAHLFEAVDETQAERIGAALRGIVSRLARKIVMGENDWLVGMMLSSKKGGAGAPRPGGGVVPTKPEGADVLDAVASATDRLVGTTALMKQAHVMRSSMRSTGQKGAKQRWL